jgi:hypothetical protein
VRCKAGYRQGDSSARTIFRQLEGVIRSRVSHADGGCGRPPHHARLASVIGMPTIRSRSSRSWMRFSVGTKTSGCSPRCVTNTADCVGSVRLRGISANGNERQADFASRLTPRPRADRGRSRRRDRAREPEQSTVIQRKFKRNRSESINDGNSRSPPTEPTVLNGVLRLTNGVTFVEFWCVNATVSDLRLRSITSEQRIAKSLYGLTSVPRVGIPPSPPDLSIPTTYAA